MANTVDITANFKDHQRNITLVGTITHLQVDKTDMGERAQITILVQGKVEGGIDASP